MRVRVMARVRVSTSMTMEKDALENLEVTVTVCFFFPEGTYSVVTA